jgi:hypothetical protein
MSMAAPMLHCNASRCIPLQPQAVSAAAFDGGTFPLLKLKE